MLLAESLIQHPWDCGVTRCLERIEGLRPGLHLTGEDVLTLMELCAKCSTSGWVQGQCTVGQYTVSTAGQHSGWRHVSERLSNSQQALHS